MSTLVVSNDKGGSAKTTTVACLSAELSRRGFSVCVIDTDPKAHFSEWHARAGHGISLIQETSPSKLVEAIAEAEGSYDVVLVDTAGSENLTNQNAIGMADLVISPAKVSAFDAGVALKIQSMVRTAEIQTKRKIPAVVILTEVVANSRIAKHAREQLVANGALVLDVEIPASVAFPEMTWTGGVPNTGTVGVRLKKLVDQLIKMKAVPTKPRGGQHAA